MTISCVLCWNIDSRKIIWPARAHFGSENESLKGLIVSSHKPVYLLTMLFTSGSSWKLESTTTSFTFTSIRPSSKNVNVTSLKFRKSVPLFMTYFPLICKKKRFHIRVIESIISLLTTVCKNFVKCRFHFI